MPPDTAAKVQPVYPTDPVFPLSVEAYHALINSGQLTHDDPVELIEGVLVFHMPKSPLHGYIVRAIDRVLGELFTSPEWHVRMQDPITLSDGEPEPDVLLVRGEDDAYLDRHPGPADAPLLIEVSDSTLLRDRGTKCRTYARAGIQNYWVVDVAVRAIEVYTNPNPIADIPRYESVERYGESDVIEIVIDGTARGRMTVESIFP